MSRSIAQFVSWIGHPLWIPSIVLLLMIQSNPYAFGVKSITDQRSVLTFISVLVCSALLPGVSVLMMKALGFIQSLHVEDKQERIGPYIASGVFYLWLFKNLNSGNVAPPLYTQFILGATLSLFGCFFANIFTKVSAHAAGMGGLVVFVGTLCFEWANSSGSVSFGTLTVSWLLLFAVVIVLAGAVGAARLALGAHTPSDLWKGYLIGGGAILLAGFFL